MAQRYISLIILALALPMAAQQMVITSPGSTINFEGNDGQLPPNVVATEQISDIDHISFAGDQMTIHKAGQATSYNVADIHRVSLSGNISQAPGFCPPSIAAKLNFETKGHPELDIDRAEIMATDPFQPANTEQINLDNTNTVLSPTAPTLYTITGSNPGATITINSSSPVMLMLDNASLAAIEVNSSADVYLASAPQSVNSLGHFHSLGTGTLHISGQGALGFETSTDNTAAIRAMGNIEINGGAINIHNTGYSGQGIYSDQDIVVNLAAINIVTTGSGSTADDSLGFDAAVGICAGVKGVKTGGNVTINNGRIRIKTVGGTGAAGIGAMHKLRIDNATVLLATFDDALNAVDEIQTNNATIFATSEVDDAIDSNGALIFRGGFMYAAGPYPKESAFDNDGKNFALENNPTMIALGAKSDAPWDYKSTTPYLRTKAITTDKYVIVRDSNNNDILAFVTPGYPGDYAMVISSPLIVKETEYRIFTTSTCVSAQELNGVLTNAVWHDEPEFVTSIISSKTK